MDLSDADFQVFRELCERYGIELATVGLCADELIEYRRSQLRDWFHEVENPPWWLSPYLGNPVDFRWEKPKDGLLQETAEIVLRILREQKIEVLETLQIPQERLLEMAVKRIPPFKDRGRGYKDAVILLTVLDHERNRAGRPECLIVARDKDFEAPQQLPEAAGLRVKVVRSLEEARKEIEDRAAAEIKAHLEYREEVLRAYLQEHRAEIQTFIRQQAPTPRYSLVGAPGLAPYEIVETMHPDTIELIEVESPFAGFLLGNVEEGRVKFSFLARIRAQATVRRSMTPWEPLEVVRTIEPAAIIGGSILLRERGD